MYEDIIQHFSPAIPNVPTRGTMMPSITMSTSTLSGELSSSVELTEVHHSDIVIFLSSIFNMFSCSAHKPWDVKINKCSMKHWLILYIITSGSFRIRVCVTVSVQNLIFKYVVYFMSSHTTPKGFQDYVKRTGYLHQCTQSIIRSTFNLHSVSAWASKLPTRVSEADWGRVAESGVGQSGGEARWAWSNGAGNHRRTVGEIIETDSRVRFHYLNHCLTVSQATQRNHVPLVGTPFLETSTEGAAV